MFSNKCTLLVFSSNCPVQKKFSNKEGIKNDDFTTNFDENAIFYKSFQTTWRQNAPLALKSDEKAYLKSSKYQKSKQQVSANGKNHALKYQFFSKIQAFRKLSCGQPKLLLLVSIIQVGLLFSNSSLKGSFLPKISQINTIN